MWFGTEYSVRVSDNCDWDLKSNNAFDCASLSSIVDQL